MKTHLYLTLFALQILMTGCVTNEIQKTTASVPVNPISQMGDSAPSSDLRTLPYDGQLFAASLAPTGSMRPTLHDHDIVLYSKQEGFETIKVGDIVLFRENKTHSNNIRLVCHRVVYRTDKFLNTKGDNNRCVDPKRITEDRYYGKLVGVIRGINPNDSVSSVIASNF